MTGRTVRERKDGLFVNLELLDGSRVVAVHRKPAEHTLALDHLAGRWVRRGIAREHG
jgi:hypothetical protein